MSDQCNHDLAERETMCADGWCPICLQTALAEADKQLAAERGNTHQALELLRKEAEAGARASEIIDHLQQQLAANDNNWRKAMSAAADLAKQTFGEKDKQLALAKVETKQHDK